MSTTRRIMTKRADGQPGNEYRDFVVMAGGLYGEDAWLTYIDHDDPVLATLPGNTHAKWLNWRDAQGTMHRDLITAAAWSPGGGWNTSVEAAAVEFLRRRDVLIEG